jgi:hypothetical protein
MMQSLFTLLIFCGGAKSISVSCRAPNTQHTLTLGKGGFAECHTLNETWSLVKGYQQPSITNGH